LNDTWSFNGTTWTQLNPATVPPARSDTSMDYDAAIGKLILFGGLNNGGTSMFNDTWTYDGTNWAQVSTPTLPAIRYGVRGVFDTSTNNYVIFGGITCTNACTVFSSLNDTWVFTGSDWAQQSPAGAPSVRTAPTMAYDQALNEIVLFGGDHYVNGTDNYVNDTWLWTGSNW